MNRVATSTLDGPRYRAAISRCRYPLRSIRKRYVLRAPQERKQAVTAKVLFGLALLALSTFPGRRKIFQLCHSKIRCWLNDEINLDSLEFISYHEGVIFLPWSRQDRLMAGLRDSDYALLNLDAHQNSRYFFGLRRWFAILGALVVREIMSYGERQWPIFTLLLLILEPIGVILVFGSISYFMLRQPVYGPSTVIFHATGILPYYFYMRISSRTRRFSAERDNRLPCIHPIDEFLALVILEYIIMCTSSIIVLGGLAYFINPLALPFNPFACLVSVTLITIFACGINLVHSAISDVSEAWVSVLIIVNRGMILISGVFFVMDFMPPPVRRWLMFNPLAHAIIWFRSGIYPRYPDYALDKSYLIICAMAALVLGFIVERAVRNFEAPGDRS